MTVINSEQCKKCPKKQCSGKELNRLGFREIKCPINYKEVKKRIKKIYEQRS